MLFVVIITRARTQTDVNTADAYEEVWKDGTSKAMHRLSQLFADVVN